MTNESMKMVMPIISVESVDTVRDFYVDKLGFDHMMGVLGKDGKLDFCTVTRGGAKLMFTRPQEAVEGTAQDFPTKRPLDIYLEVDDVDGYCNELKQRGVEITSGPEDQWWGDRVFTITDPYGYSILFFQTGGEFTPPQGMKIV